MKRILLIFVSKNLNFKDKRCLFSIKKNIIENFKNQNFQVDIAAVTSEPYKNQYQKILGNFKYNIISKGGQLSKIIDLLEKITFNEYEWFIKIRPEVLILEPFSFENFSKEKLNSRVRHYYGPFINIKKIVSVPSHEVKKSQDSDINIKCFNRNDFKHYDEEIIHPDDQIFIFHRNIVMKGFRKLKKEDWTVEKIGKEKSKMIYDNWETQRESFFANVMKHRDVKINPVSLDIIFRNMRSGDLKIDEKTKSVSNCDLSWLYQVWTF